jgi:hypothetical protein
LPQINHEICIFEMKAMAIQYVVLSVKAQEKL